MKVVIPGGTGHLGELLVRALGERGDEVVVLTRNPAGHDHAVSWDGRTLGPWASEIDGADAVINLAGRSVNCRYTRANLEQMMRSRVDSTDAVGLAITQSVRPPRVWLQMSTATIYAHRFDAPNDEMTGLIGGQEPDVPGHWAASVGIACAWEKAQASAPTPQTRKVLLRTAMVMSLHSRGVFPVLLNLTRWGMGGPIAGGQQFMSWIHEVDFVRALEFLLEREDLEGPINLTSPHPLPQREVMDVLRTRCGVPVGLPTTAWMAELGARLLQTETELLFKSRRVVPRRLLEAGFAFDFPTWPEA
ncbi:MAG: uncharacterized protein QOF51_604, partial [Chloroflexota bacterium]|nr:uncharacterized protein [Chloroflexota bacterium]